MRETLEALYFGNLHPTETAAHKKSRYWKIAKQTNEAYDNVIKVVTDAQRSAFDTFVSMQLSTQAEGGIGGIYPRISHRNTIIARCNYRR